VKLTIHLYLVPRSRMRGALPPLPRYAFMASCSVKKGTGKTLPLSFTITKVKAKSHTKYRRLKLGIRGT